MGHTPVPQPVNTFQRDLTTRPAVLTPALSRTRAPPRTVRGGSADFPAHPVCYPQLRPLTSDLTLQLPGPVGPDPLQIRPGPLEPLKWGDFP